MTEYEPIEYENWFKTYWRPAAAWVYLGICLFDFVAAPIFFGWFSWFTKTEMQAWTPLTLQGGGLFHLSFGAIIGIYTWKRSEEKFQEVEYDQINYGTPRAPVAPRVESSPPPVTPTPP